MSAPAAPPRAPLAEQLSPLASARATARTSGRSPISTLPWLVGALVLLTGLLLLNHYPVGVAFDDGMYVILAKALATGQGYHWIHVPGAPAATHFPPGYPAVLALLWRLWPVFPANVLLFKAANALFLALTGVGVTRLALRRFALPPWGAALFALVTTLGIPMLILSTMVMSEPLFLALAVATLLWAERTVERRSGVGELLLLGVAMGAASLVRTHGVALVGGVGLVLFIQRRWRDAALVVAGAAVALGPWMYWVATHQGVVPPAMRGNYESYTGWLLRGVREQGPALFGATLERTVPATLGMLRVLFAPSVSGLVAVAALCAIVALFAIGAWQLWRRAPVTAAFLGLYSAIVLLWPFAPARFFWGVWPLLLALPLLAVRWLWRWHPVAPLARVGRGALLAAAALLVVGHGIYTTRAVRGRWWSSISRQQTAEFRPLVTWVRSRTNPHEVIASVAEDVVYLYGGRLAVPAGAFTASDFVREPTVEERRDALRQILDRYDVDALVLTRATTAGIWEGARALATEHPPRLVPRDSFALGRVLSRVPPPERATVSPPLSHD